MIATMEGIIDMMMARPGVADGNEYGHMLRLIPSRKYNQRVSLGNKLISPDEPEEEFFDFDENIDDRSSIKVRSLSIVDKLSRKERKRMKSLSRTSHSSLTSSSLQGYWTR